MGTITGTQKNTKDNHKIRPKNPDQNSDLKYQIFLVLINKFRFQLIKISYETFLKILNNKISLTLIEKYLI
jgi:hypothetical protein